MKKHKTKLIEGNFTKDKAMTLLHELLTQKIRFHQMQKFSSVERYGKDLDHSEKRIAELTEGRQRLVDWINSLAETDSIEIVCDIHLGVK